MSASSNGPRANSLHETTPAAARIWVREAAAKGGWLMHPRVRVISLHLAFCALAAFWPAAVGAQSFILQWGSPGSGDGQFNEPRGVATDAAGNVYVVDSGNARVQKFTNTGVYLTQWGSPGSGDGQFSANPWALAADAAGNVFVSDLNNVRIQKFTSAGAYVTQWGSFGSGNGEFDLAFGVAVDPAGYVYVTEDLNNRIQKFTNAGTYVTQWPIQGSGSGGAGATGALCLATDPVGNVYVGVDGTHIEKYTSTGTFLTQWGSFGTGAGQFRDLEGLATDASGNVYATDSFNSTVQKFTSTGTYLSQLPPFGGAPFGVATDASGNIYVADIGNSCIKKYGPGTTAASATTWGRLKSLYRR
jgi:streptogramin lyase